MNKLSRFKNVVSLKRFKPDSFVVDNSVAQSAVLCFTHLPVFYELCKLMILLISRLKYLWIAVYGCVKLRISAAKLCVLFVVLLLFVDPKVLGAWLLSFSFKHDIWCNWGTSGLLNIWYTVIVMAVTGSWERDSTATSGLCLDCARTTEGSIANSV